jgi:Zn-dependent protease
MDNLFNWPPSWSTLLLLPALFVAFTVHELAHALVAYLLGDTSQVERKRLSFNPLRHVSWLGMIAFLLVGLGWAKPVWVDHTRFRIRNRAFGMFLVSIAGATANLLTALLALLGMSATIAALWLLAGASPLDVMQFLVAAQPGPDLQGLAVALSYYMVTVNVLLAVFNLLPFPPLDGFQAALSLIATIRHALQSRKGERPPPAPTVAPSTVPPSSAAVSGEALPSAALDSAGDSEMRPADIHLKIGLDYHKEGQWDEAIARYRQATAHDEEFSLAYYNLGLAYWAKGRLPLAASSFRAAAASARDMQVSMQAELRLRELAQAEQDPDADPSPASPPLEPGAPVELPAAGPPALDPEVARRITLRLIIGGVVMAALAIGMWVFVTVVAFVSVGTS